MEAIIQKFTEQLDWIINNNIDKIHYDFDMNDTSIEHIRVFIYNNIQILLINKISMRPMEFCIKVKESENHQKCCIKIHWWNPTFSIHVNCNGEH